MADARGRGGTCCPSGRAWLPGPAERIVMRTELLTGCSLTLLRTERAVNPGFGQTASCSHRGPMAGRGAVWGRADTPVCLRRREQAALPHSTFSSPRLCSAWSWGPVTGLAAPGPLRQPGGARETPAWALCQLSLPSLLRCPQHGRPSGKCSLCVAWGRIEDSCEICVQ